ncbi:hypothetical protein BJV78DRAFT_263659 [Lactifluus subvellereus]|nr:hypothetical protein BJV78DRAFT_263659 [Lactifluus subvellereus]
MRSRQVQWNQTMSTLITTHLKWLILPGLGASDYVNGFLSVVTILFKRALWAILSTGKVSGAITLWCQCVITTGWKCFQRSHPPHILSLWVLLATLAVAHSESRDNYSNGGSDGRDERPASSVRALDLGTPPQQR